jgi:serine/threonine protein kinase
MFLGRGAMGDVYEVNVSGNKLAHKRMVMKRKLGGKERKEIDILKAIPKHHHIIELVGTYTHRQFLGILLYPVAVCDLHTFFEDAEAWHDTASESKTQENRSLMLEASQKSRLLALGYDFPDAQHRYSASLIYSKIGCLISAISYLHDQKIRHKDLKPSNILLSRDRIWLSDFGSATDFSLLSQSATDNERGSPRYFSPEVSFCTFSRRSGTWCFSLLLQVFAWQPNGRAADIFSLGCVLLEIVVLHDQGMLHHMHTNRSPHPSFHANLDRVDTWLQSPKRLSWSRRRAHLVVEIKSMLAYDPAMRPNARQLLTEIVGYDLSQMTTSKHSVFGTCCRKQLMSLRERQDLVSSHEKAITELQKALFDSNSEQLRLNTEREQRAIQYENSRNEMVVDLTKIKGQMKKAVAKNSKFLRVIGHRDSDLNKLAFELASVKGKLMEREAENVRLVGLVNTLSLQDEV